MLSRRETQLFALLGQGYRPAEIASEMFLSVKTVEAYSARIKEKLGATDARDLARRAIAWMKTQPR